jgi:hypothetical protein
MFGILANVLAGVIFSFVSIVGDVVATGQLPDIGAFLGVIAAFITLTMLGTVIALYLTRRSPQAETIESTLASTYLHALDASSLNPRRPAHARHG